MPTIIELLTLFFLSCSISTTTSVIIYFIFKKELQRRSSRLMFSMALADLLGASFWFIDMLHSLCPLNLIMNLYGYQAAQLWSCIMGAYLILKFTDKPMPPEFVFHLIAWGLPFIPQAYILSMHLYSAHPPPQGCWIEFGRIEMLAIALPQIITVALNACFLAFICFFRRSARSTRWGFKNRDQSLFLIQIWCFANAFSSILQSFPHAPSWIYSLSYILGAGQGLFNTLAMRQAYVSRFFSWTNSKLANVRHSLTVPPLLRPIDSSGPVSYVSSYSHVEQDEHDHDEHDDATPPTPHAIIAPSTTLLIHPGSAGKSYRKLPSSDIN